MRTISATVGQGGKNVQSDVVTVQELLNKVPPSDGGPSVPLKVDGLAWNKSIDAIKHFQKINLGHKWPDGRVDASGKTLSRLNTYDTPETPLPKKEPPPPQYIYFVPGKKVVIGQPTSRTCWATVYTMLRCWREHKTFAIAEALHGLLAVGAASDIPPFLGLHLRVMEGISVAGTPSDCYYMIVPGFGGKKYPERTFDFETKYNYAMSLAHGANWQVAHYY